MSPRRQADSPIKPLLCLRQQILVDARLIVEPFQVSGRDQLDQVLVALLRLAQQDEVIVAVRIRAGLMTLLRNINLAPDDGMDTLFRGFVIKLDGPEQVAMIRHRNRRHLLAFHDLDQLLDVARAIEERVVSVAVEVNERTFRHAGHHPV